MCGRLLTIPVDAAVSPPIGGTYPDGRAIRSSRPIMLMPLSWIACVAISGVRNCEQGARGSQRSKTLDTRTATPTCSHAARQPDSQTERMIYASATGIRTNAQVQCRSR